MDPEIQSDEPLSLSAGIAAYSKGLDDNGQEKEISDLEPSQEVVKDEPEEDIEDDVPEDEEPEEEDDEPAENDNEDQPEPTPLVAADEAKVKLSDGSEVTVAELKSSYFRQSDYSQKTEAHKRDLQAFAAEKAEVVENLQRERELVQAYAQQMLPKPPSETMLDPNSPDFNLVGFQQQTLAYQRQMGMLQQIGTQHQAYLQQQKELADKEFADTRRLESEKLLERVPEMKDKKTHQRFWSDAIKAGAEVYGFSQQELELLNDHRDYMVLNDALKYRRIMAKKARATTKTENKPPVLQGSTRRSPAEQAQQDYRAKMDKLKKTGSLKDGIAALLASETG